MREVVAKEVAALREEVSSCKTLIRERFRKDLTLFSNGSFKGGQLSIFC